MSFLFSFLFSLLLSSFLPLFISVFRLLPSFVFSVLSIPSLPLSLTSFLLPSSYLFFFVPSVFSLSLTISTAGFRCPADLPVFFEHAHYCPCHCAQGHRVKTSSLTYPFLFSVFILVNRCIWQKFKVYM